MSGSLLLAIDGAEVLLADSTTFRTRVGAADAAAAKASIHYWQTDPADYFLGQYTLEVQRPCAVLMIGGHGFSQIGVDARHTMGASHGILVLLTDNARVKEDAKASFRDFVDWTSAVIDEMALLFGGSQSPAVPYFPFRDVELVQPAERSSLADRPSDDFYECSYLLRASVQEGG